MRSTHRLLPALCLGLLCVALLSVPALAGPKAACAVGPYSLSFAKMDHGQHNATFWKDGQPLHSVEHSFSDPVCRVRRDFPTPGATTALFTAYSGGAHCCTILYLLTKTGQGARFQAAETLHSSPRATTASGRGVIAFSDNRFAYYSPGGDLFLSFAQSPAPMRFLVLDQGGWRIDKPGELAARYRAALAELRRKSAKAEDDGAVSAGIAMAYLHLMAGGSGAEARSLLETRLAGPWRQHADRILEDVARQVLAYTPLVDMETEADRLGEMTNEGGMRAVEAFSIAYKNVRELLQEMRSARQD